MATNSSDNIKRSDNIRLGIICECEEGANFGWLYSYLCYYYKTDQSESKVNSIRLFFTFKKKTDFVLSDGTPVAFVSIDDINGYAENIMELNNLPFLDSETGKESDDQIIDEYNHKRLPYWEICYKSKSSNPDYYCLIYPVNDRVTHESKLAYSVLVGKEKDLFKLIYSLHKIAYKYLSLDEMTQKLVSIKKYVDSFSIEEVLKTYQCYEWGYLQYRPGRDDHTSVS